MIMTVKIWAVRDGGDAIMTLVLHNTRDALLSAMQGFMVEILDSSWHILIDMDSIRNEENEMYVQISI